MSSYITFRINHTRRKLGRQSQVMRTWFGNYIDRHVYGAWRKLGLMRWQFAAWVLIIVISIFGMYQGFMGLRGHWLARQPINGGVYREGVIGRVRLVNPLYVENSATADIAELVFSKLIRTRDGQYVEGDLADNWEVSADKRTYTLKLREDAHWHDGVLVTSDDVVYTIQTIQNPDARSSLATNWDKIQVSALDSRTVQFKLPASYSGFWSALAQVGILPKHVLEQTPVSQLRLASFNQQPIGSGPFILDNLDINSDTISLRRYNEYYQGAPKLDEIEFLQVDDSDALVDAYAKRRIDGMAQVDSDKVASVKEFGDLVVQRFRMPSYVGAFYNIKQPALANKDIRLALSQVIDRKKLVQEVVKDEGNVAHYPIPAGYLGFNQDALRVDYAPEAGKATLAQKITTPLRLVTANSGVYPELAQKLADQWRVAGVPIEVIQVDTFTLQQSYIRPRQYDILLYGQNIGADSDVFSFWHSSQASDPGLNVSQYDNKEADTTLEQARFGKDPAFRDMKYKSFVKIWSGDVPALLLYSPTYLYAHTAALTGVAEEKLVTPSDRFYKVNTWAIKSKLQPIKQQ
jgi:peptide/nickel transport system substrate-binding protein